MNETLEAAAAAVKAAKQALDLARGDCDTAEAKVVEAREALFNAKGALGALGDAEMVLLTAAVLDG